MRRGIKSIAGIALALFLSILGSDCDDNPLAVDTPWPLKCPDVPFSRAGEATFYVFASGAGSCMFDSTPGDLMVAAMNATDYYGSDMCGACVLVTGPRGSALVRIVDLCPECKPGDIDLSPQAFSRIADTTLGRVNVAWTLLPCGIEGPITYHFMTESNRWWTAVQVRNHRNPVYSLEYLPPQGPFKRVKRTGYNYFVEGQGMGPGPFVFRVTDVYGHVLVDSGVVLAVDTALAGKAQFPPCNQ